VTLEEIVENLGSRDLIDSTRDHSPLTQAEDAIVIDNSDLSIEEQFDHMMACVKQVLEG
jgi:cytidylate kinase